MQELQCCLMGENYHNILLELILCTGIAMCDDWLYIRGSE